MRQTRCNKIGLLKEPVRRKLNLPLRDWKMSSKESLRVFPQ